MIPLSKQIKKDKNELRAEIGNQNYFSVITEIGDNQTKKVTLRSRKVYLFINSHINQRCVMLITYFDGIGMRTDVIYKSSDDAVPKISSDNDELTITTKSLARGKLFQLNALNCG